METRASYILVGICVLGLLGAGVAIALWLARPQVETALYYMARFDEDVTGLRTGGDVRFHGVRVGEVASIRIDAETEQIEVKLQVEEGTPIRQSTVARLQSQGITGASFIQLQRAKDAVTGGSDALVAGRSEAPFPEIESELSELQAVFKEFPEVLGQIKAAATQVAELLNDRNLDSITKSLENLNRITDDLTSQTGAISGVFVKVESTLDTAEETLVSIGQLSHKIDGAIDEVTKGVNAFEKMTTNVDAFVEENRRPIADFSATGLYEMTQFLIDARELIQTLNRVSIRLENDPARFLFGDTHGGVQAQ